MKECPEQLDLFETRNGFPQPSISRIRKVEETALRLAREHGLKVRVVRWKTNRRVMASVGKNGVLNLHRIYQRATELDLISLANVMSGRAGSRDRERFERFIDRFFPRELGEGKSRLVVRPGRGLFHDLDKTLGRLLPLLDRPLRTLPKVGWSPVRVGRRGITWGTHRDTPEGPLILVNAILDAPDVPAFIVDHIVWHELCHQASPPENGSNGRRKVHSKAFIEFEERFPHLKRAEQWEVEQVARLIKRHYKRGRR